MNEVLQQQYDYARNSGLGVSIDEVFGWVAMTLNGEDLAFLQGEVADDFIEQVNNLYNDEEEDLTFDQAAMICGYPYCDLIH